MNKAHGITKENLLASLPAVLANDDNMAALASAVAEVLAARVGEIERVSIYSQIDRLPNELLDILANDFKVDWWDANYTLEEKRRTLKDSWNVHRRLGTKAAVVLAISAIYPDTQVSEWWEYGGKPYHFKLLIDATYGRRTRAVLVMDSDHIVLSAIQPETVAGRLGAREAAEAAEEEGED